MSKYADIVIGPAGTPSSDADYVCTSTNAHTIINNAIISLGTDGGKVLLLKGLYNIYGKIVLKDNVTLSGMGRATVLKRMFQEISGNEKGVITASMLNSAVIENLSVNGNKNSYSSSSNQCISIYDSFDIFIKNCYLHDADTGIFMQSQVNAVIQNNFCANGNSGIYTADSSNVTITGNLCITNKYGIYLNNNSQYNTVTGNICEGSLLNNLSVCGIRIGTQASFNTVSANVAFITEGIQNNYSENMYTISLDDTSLNNLVIGNSLPGRDAINHGPSNNNIVINNKY